MQEPHNGSAKVPLAAKSAERLNQSPRDGVARKDNRPSAAQLSYLRRGLDQAGGKLPLFDSFGQTMNPRTVRSCIDQGWAEPWFDNPLKPDWLVCKLTEEGRNVLAQWNQGAKITPFPG